MLLLAANPWSLVAASGRVLQTETTYVFSEFLDLRIEAQADSPITEAILFYGLVGEQVVRRIYPELVPGTSVQIEHREQLERGQYPPGASFRYWWRLKTSAGDLFESDVETIRYEDSRFTWEESASERITLYWYGRGIRPDALLASAEKALQRIEEQIGVRAASRIQIYAYPNERDMRAALGIRSDDYDARVTTLGVVVSDDTLIVLGTYGEVDRILAHELSHIVVGLATDNPYAGLPRWLDEGLAMIAEGPLPPRNQRALEQAVAQDALLSVRAMTSYSGRAEEVDLFYGSSHSVVSFLLDEYGRDRMRQLLTVFSEGVHQETALQRVYGIDLDELDALWRTSLGLSPRLPSQSRFSCPMPSNLFRSELPVSLLGAAPAGMAA